MRKVLSLLLIFLMSPACLAAYPTPARSYGLQDDAANLTVTATEGLDVTGTGFVDTAAVSTTGPGGSFPKAFLLDGVDDYANKTDYQTTTTTTLTVCGWVNTTNSSIRKTIISEYQSTAGADSNRRWWFALDGSGKVEFSLRLSGTNNVIQSSSSHSTTAWQHVAATWDGGPNTVKFYFDGVEEASASGSPPSTINAGTNSPLVVGNLNGSTTSSFNGSLADVRIWESVLTEAQIQEVRDEGITSSGAGILFPLADGINFPSQTGGIKQ